LQDLASIFIASVPYMTQGWSHLAGAAAHHLPMSSCYLDIRDRTLTLMQLVL